MRAALRVLLLLLLPVAGWAGASAQTAFDFLFLDANARPAALAGAYSTLSDGADALSYNPAGLAFADGYEATFMDNEYLEGVTQQAAGFSAPRGWGLHLNRIGYGELQRTTLSQPDGAGTFEGGAWVLGGGLAKRMHPRVGLGAGVKLIRETLDEVRAQGWALDLGLLADLPKTRLALTVRNLGDPVRYESVSEALPWSGHAGISRELGLFGQRQILAVEVSQERGESPTAAVGIEMTAAGKMTLRAGWSSRADAGPGAAAGIGWRFGGHSVDYAFVPLGELGSAHRFSFTLRWGARPRPAALPPPAESDLLPPGSRGETFLGRAESFIQSGLYREARRDYLSAQGLLPADDPRQVLILERLGRIAEESRMFEVAERRYRKAIGLAERIGAPGAASEARQRLDKVLIKSGQ